MQIRAKLFKALICSGFLTAIISQSGCAEFPGVYKVAIEQGNILTQEMVAKLEKGQSKEQVRFILGNPLIIDTFSEDRWDYAYRTKRGKKYTSQSNLIVYFENGALSHWQEEDIPDIKR